MYSPIGGDWQQNPLCDSVKAIAKGSYKNKTRDQIQSSGYVMHTLEAALWGFYNSDNFKTGALDVVNLGDDADSVGAVYGQIAGAYYGEMKLPVKWIIKLWYRHVFYLKADELLENGYKA